MSIIYRCPNGYMSNDDICFEFFLNPKEDFNEKMFLIEEKIIASWEVSNSK